MCFNFFWHSCTQTLRVSATCYTEKEKSTQTRSNISRVAAGYLICGNRNQRRILIERNGSEIAAIVTYANAT